MREAVAAAYVEEGSPAKAVNEFILVGDVHFRNRAYEEALAVYRRALELGPDNLRTLGKLVSAYEAAGEVEAAAEVLFDMADIYARRSLTWKSREAATRALRLAPGEAVLRRYLERSAVAGELASAVAAVEELMPFFPRRFQGRARELLAEGGRGGRAPTEARPQAASSFGQPAWQAFRDPSPAAGAPAPPHGHGRAPEPPAPSESGADPRRTLVEALHLFSRRRYSRALAKLDEVAGLPRAGLSQNDLADLFSAKGQCLIELGYPRDAIEPFESGLSLSGLDAEREMSLQYGLARALEESGDRERAMDLYKWVYLKDASYRDVKIRLLWSKKK
ncbi:hypothetical protein HS125_19725 [bacterium]|nr:hypothetical protein [bacterium]